MRKLTAVITALVVAIAFALPAAASFPDRGIPPGKNIDRIIPPIHFP